MMDSEDHIDELFRSARDHYPLKTGEGDWDKVQALLQKGMGESTVEASKTTNKNKWRLLWLLLLLPLGWMFYATYNNNNGSSRFNKIPTSEASVAGHSLAKTYSPDKKIITPVRVENQTGHVNTRSYQAANSFVDSKNYSINSTDDAIQSLHNMAKSNFSAIDAQLLSNPLILPDGNVTTQPLLLPDNALVSGGLKGGKKIEPNQLISSQSLDTAIKKNSIAYQPVHNKKRGFYFGVLAGPDISTIKLQQVKNAGYSLGILLGYRLNKRFSLETNFLWDKKNYYTDGKYVNKQDLSIPSTISIINLNGYCHMYELDLTGRYDFSPNKRQHFFARGGLASYFMKKQDYSYLAAWSNGSQYSYSLDYENATNNLFSVLHISAGYEYKVGKISMRIEPYLKIPTEGLGSGKLPVTSMSLYMGISVPLR